MERDDDEKDKIEYLSRVFKELSADKKECLLHTAQHLLKLQEDAALLLGGEGSVFQNDPPIRK